MAAAMERRGKTSHFHTATRIFPEPRPRGFLEDSLFDLFIVSKCASLKVRASVGGRSLFLQFLYVFGLCEKGDGRVSVCAAFAPPSMPFLLKPLVCASANGFWFNFILCTGRSSDARRKLSHIAFRRGRLFPGDISIIEAHTSQSALSNARAFRNIVSWVCILCFRIKKGEKRIESSNN